MMDGACTGSVGNYFCYAGGWATSPGRKFGQAGSRVFAEKETGVPHFSWFSRSG